MINQPTNTDALTFLAKAAADGVLTLRVAKTLDMTQAAKAHRLVVGGGGMRGQVVLTFKGWREERCGRDRAFDPTLRPPARPRSLRRRAAR